MLASYKSLSIKIFRSKTIFDRLSDSVIALAQGFVSKVAIQTFDTKFLFLMSFACGYNAK